MGDPQIRGLKDMGNPRLEEDLRRQGDQSFYGR